MKNVDMHRMVLVVDDFDAWLVAELVDHRQHGRFLPSLFIDGRIVGIHAGSSDFGAHDGKILCGWGVIVNNIVGLRSNGRAF